MYGEYDVIDSGEKHAASRYAPSLPLLPSCHKRPEQWTCGRLHHGVRVGLGKRAFSRLLITVLFDVYDEKQSIFMTMVKVTTPSGRHYHFTVEITAVLHDSDEKCI